MFRKKKKEDEICPEVEYVRVPSKRIELSVEELHAWNSLEYYATEKNLARELRARFSTKSDFYITEIDYGIWMLNSGKFSGIEKTIADSLLSKLKEALNAFY